MCGWQPFLIQLKKQNKMTTTKKVTKKKEKFKPDFSKDIFVAQQHVFYLIVCAKKGSTTEDIEAVANHLNPTGVSRPWSIPEFLVDGKKNEPIQCASMSDRLHYYLNC